MVKVIQVMIVVYVLAFLLMVCGCANDSNPSDNAGTSIQNPPSETVGSSGKDDPATKPQIPDVQEELPFGYLLDSGFDRSQGISIPDFGYAGANIAFDFGELPKDAYPSGEWSVNELEAKYGEAIKIQGSIPTTDILEIGIRFSDMSLILRTTRNGTFSFDSDSNEQVFYSLSDQDRFIKIPVYTISVYGEEFPLPRGLKIGQSSIEDVKNAYPVEGCEVIGSPDPGVHSISYKYTDFDAIASKQGIGNSDIGYIIYYFKNDILSAIQIGWGPA